MLPPIWPPTRLPESPKPECGPYASWHRDKLDPSLRLEYSDLTIEGRHEGFKKISFTKLLQREAGLGLADAKHVTDGDRLAGPPDHRRGPPYPAEGEEQALSLAKSSDPGLLRPASTSLQLAPARVSEAVLPRERVQPGQSDHVETRRAKRRASGGGLATFRVGS